MNNRNMPVCLGDTSLLDEETWLKWRMYGGPEGKQPYCFGGSDIAAILNISPWTSAAELYARKKNWKMKFSAEKNASAKAAGHLYEPYVGQLFKQKMESMGHKVDLITDKNMYQCGEYLKDNDGFPVLDADGEPVLKYPYALADVDGTPIVDGKMEILECKTTSSHNFETIGRWKAGIVPEYYECQCRWYMKVMDLDRTWICCAWGFGPDDFAIIPIERDPEIEDEIMENAAEFVRMLENDTPPDPKKGKPGLISDFYSRLYGRSENQELKVVTEKSAEPSVIRLKKIDAQIENKKTEIKKLEEQKLAELNVLNPYIGDNRRVRFEGSKVVAYLEVRDDMERDKITEESVKAVDPLLVNRGYGSFSQTLFKSSMSDEMKLLKKNAAQEKRNGNVPAYEALMKKAEEFAELLAKCTIPGSWKGTKTFKLSYYDPKDPSAAAARR